MKIRKIVPAVLAAIMLTACGGNQTPKQKQAAQSPTATISETKAPEKDTGKEEQVDNSSSSLNADKYEKAEFSRLSSYKSGKRVTVDGEVIEVFNPRTRPPYMVICQAEGDGYGVYEVQMANIYVKAGDHVNVLGLISEMKGETVPKLILGISLEKK